MELFISIVSLIVGVVSIVLAIVSMAFSKSAEQQSQHNYEKTQELLAEIDKKAAVIDSVVQKNQEQMMSTLTNIVNETIIPKKPNFGEQIGADLLKSAITSPENFKNFVEGFSALKDIADSLPKKNPENNNGV